MNGASALLLLLLSGRAALTDGRSLNAARDEGVLPPDGHADSTDALTVTGK